MFDITSSKLLLLGIVALLVIGPKDFPALLRTIGKYLGIIRGHAREFRAQFDEAMRESELADLKKDVENIARETEASLHATERSVESSLDEARVSLDEVRQGVDSSLDTTVKPPPDPLANDTDSLPPPQAADSAGLNGAHTGDAPVADADETADRTPAEQNPPAEKRG